MGLIRALSRLVGKKAARTLAADLADEVPRVPLRPMREVGPGGMTVAPRSPYRTSLKGGSDDLMEELRGRKRPRV
jgi:hypothetical protein